MGNLIGYSGTLGVLDLGDGFYQTTFRTYVAALGRFLPCSPIPPAWPAETPIYTGMPQIIPSRRLTQQSLRSIQPPPRHSLSKFSTLKLLSQKFVAFAEQTPEVIEFLARGQPNIAAYEAELAAMTWSRCSGDRGPGCHLGAQSLPSFIAFATVNYSPPGLAAFSTDQRLKENVIKGLPENLVNSLLTPLQATPNLGQLLPTLPSAPEQAQDEVDPNDLLLAAYRLKHASFIRLINSLDPNEIVGPLRRWGQPVHHR